MMERVQHHDAHSPSAPASPQVPGLVEVYDPAAQRCTFLLPLEQREDLLRPSH